MKSPRPFVTVNSTLLRKALLHTSANGRAELLKLLFPDKAAHLIRLFARHPAELTASGTSLKYPASWDELAGDPT